MGAGRGGAGRGSDKIILSELQSLMLEEYGESEGGVIERKQGPSCSLEPGSPRPNKKEEWREPGRS